MEVKKTAAIFDALVNHRRAVRQFDQEEAFDQGLVRRSLERAVLSPNSSNMQLWEFIHLQSPATLEQIAPLCLNQQAAKTARAIVAIVVRRDLWPARRAAVLAQQTAVFKTEGGGVLTDKHKRLLTYWETHVPLLHRSGGGFWDVIKELMTSWKGLKKPVMRSVTSRAMRLSAHRSAALAAQTFMWSIAAEGYDSCPMEGYDEKRVKAFLNLPKTAELAMLVAVGKRTAKGVYGPRLRVPFEEVYTAL
ncbi:MAG: nitroreductase family protein [Aureispira sp.]